MPEHTRAQAGKRLMATAITWLAQWCGTDPDYLPDGFPAGDDRALGDYRRLLAGDWTAPQPGQPLLCIFSRIHSPDDPAPQRYWPIQPLSLEPVAPLEKEAAQAGDRAALWRGFERELSQLLARPLDADRRLESFGHLLQKWAWAVPCSYGEPGVSLYDEFRTLTALVYASQFAPAPAPPFSLIGGDVPGIQDFVYTITSKGAAKGLRGRSLFVQLVGDAVVQRVLRRLDLGPANVVYNAGGNFVLLGPGLDAQVQGQTVRAHLQSLQRDIDEALLDAFEGDLALCLAWTRLEADQIGRHRFSTEASWHLKHLVAQEKRGRFQAIASARWKDLFGPRDRPGNRYCVICQRPLGRDQAQSVEMEGTEALPAEQRARRCRPCEGFKKLAETIGREGMLALGPTAPTAPEPWQEALRQVGGIWYRYAPRDQLQRSDADRLYTINDPDFTGRQADGFRFLANVTPQVTQADLERWKQDPDPDEERPWPGGIRTFGQMAEVARGVKRVGVLRMDVDDLGQTMVHGLRPRTLAATSALSQALERFFGGYLNRICERVNQIERRDEAGADRGDRLYVIYAGGDDLFVVGSWDLMPELAEQIQSQFRAYTGHHPGLHISAGITLEGAKFPLYQAASRAGQAEEAAKHHTRDQVAKDAIFFLGLTFKWDEWDQVTQRRREIVAAVGPDKASRALIQVLQNIYTQYEDQVEKRNRSLQQRGEPLPEEPAYHPYFGPWVWREAYALTRMADRVGPKEIKQAVRNLQVDALSLPSIRHVGLAARWAELLTRKEQES